MGNGYGGGAHTLLSLCFRYYNEKQEIGEKEEHQKKHGYLEKVLSYIDAHFAEPMTLEMLAEKAMVSRTYLCRCFRIPPGRPCLLILSRPESSMRRIF